MSPSARRPSSGFDVDNEEADVRVNVAVADRHADIPRSPSSTLSPPSPPLCSFFCCCWGALLRSGSFHCHNHLFPLLVAILYYTFLSLSVLALHGRISRAATGLKQLSDGQRADAQRHNRLRKSRTSTEPFVCAYLFLARARHAPTYACPSCMNARHLPAHALPMPARALCLRMLPCLFSLHTVHVSILLQSDIPLARVFKGAHMHRREHPAELAKVVFSFSG